MATPKYTPGQQLYTIKAGRLLPFVPVTVLPAHTQGNWPDTWYHGHTGTGLVLTVKETEAFASPYDAIDHHQTAFIEEMARLHAQAKEMNP